MKAITVDRNGNAYAAGYTTTSVNGQAPLGGEDAFITKWSPDGDLLWSTQWGSSSDDEIRAIAANSTGDRLAVAGTVGGTSWIGLFDPAPSRGSFLWKRSDLPSGSANAVVFGADGDIYAGGFIVGGAFEGQVSAGGSDAYLLRLNAAAGYTAWVRQWGKPARLHALSGLQVEFDVVNGLGTDGSDIYVVGNYNMGGQYGGADCDAFVTIFSQDGKQGWERVIDNGHYDVATAVAVDKNGNAVVAGRSVRTSDINGINAENSYIFAAFTKKNSPLWDQDTVDVTDLAIAGDGKLYALANGVVRYALATGKPEWREYAASGSGGIAVVEEAGKVVRILTPNIGIPSTPSLIVLSSE